MSYDYNMNRILEAVPSNSEFKANYIINYLLYDRKNANESTFEKRLDPNQVQLLVDELSHNIKTIPGELFAEEEMNGNGMFILKGGVPILYKGRFIKGQFDNEIMVSTMSPVDGAYTKKMFDSQIITRNYIIGKNGLFENNNGYFNFIDLIKKLENCDENLPLHYFYYPNNEPNKRIFIDRQLGYRTVEETFSDGKVKSQIFKFNQNKLKASNVRMFSGALSGDELLEAIYNPKPIEDVSINYQVKPKAYQKVIKKAGQL